MEQVDHFDAGVLFVDFLVFGPPFPWKAVDQFGQLLAHGAGVVEGPLGLILRREVGEVDPDLFVEDILHPENFIQLVRIGHRRWVAGGGEKKEAFLQKNSGRCEEAGKRVGRRELEWVTKNDA